MSRDNRVSTAPPPVIARVDVHVLRWPVKAPVRTSFGTMHDRPAVLVRVEDGEGAHGWGEAWCNFPSCGAEHRARLIETVLAPLVTGRAFATPQAAFAEMTEKTAVLAIQSGEPGPIAQAIAGVDLALHDLAARRRGLPLWRQLAPDANEGSGRSGVAVYASGINPERPGETVAGLRRAGYSAFKLKVGFGEARDIANLAEVRAAAGAEAAVMVDANQAWDLATASAMATRLAASAPAWLEEPLRADRPWPEWQRLAAASPIPLAAGENMIGDDAFAALVASGAIAVVQPDLAKWGGISGVIGVIERVAAAGLRYCPHYLGAGIGLLASAHLLAARGGAASWLEVDANENPLRTLLCPPLATLDNGWITLSEAPGLGCEPDLAALRSLCA
ncbi:MAG: mandelate racemase/muconate lactonizing enzyme family protein [Burkholderiales bacterium]|nr:mandelate racemase/muconate lactonizing enzyme family protein [Burkholderiales bacterium]